MSRSKVNANNYPLYLQIQLSGISIVHNSKELNGSLKAISLLEAKRLHIVYEI